MKNLFDISLADVIPENLLADEKIRAAIKALDVELRRLSVDSQLVMHIPRLDYLPHDVLNHLAYQFHVDHYEPETMSLEVKRNLIRESIYFHRIKGTPASLREFLGYFGIGAQAQEWFTYDGDPYYFRLKLTDVAYLDDDGDTFMRLVYSAKNERSWLDAFIFDLGQVQQDIYTGRPEITANVEVVSGANVADSKIYLDAKPANVDADKEVIKDTDFDNRILPISVVSFIGEVISEDIFPAPDPDESLSYFYEWIWLLYQLWKKNAIWETYKDEEEPDEEDEVVMDGNFLRLIFEFPRSRRKRITLPDPLESITAKEINSVGNFAVERRALVDVYGNPPLKLAQAMIIRRQFTRLDLQD